MNAAIRIFCAFFAGWLTIAAALYVSSNFQPTFLFLHGLPATIPGAVVFLVAFSWAISSSKIDITEDTVAPFALLALVAFGVTGCIESFVGSCGLCDAI